ncbi:MAG: ABC transporter substrate-binding protein [Acidobacteria bacterium]|jgi:branched-chain amino acid transport system substrate-binding protein|nr:ABC transporter substrate-binding protein [Acidobacteriota bacterium]
MVLRAFAVAVAAVACFACLSPDEADRGDASAQRVDPVVLVPGDAPTPGAVRLAAVFPTVDRYAASGMQSLNGVRLAVDEINHAGGIHGRRLELREYRTGSYFVDAQRAAVLAIEDGALGIVGANSSELSKAIAEEVEARGVVQVSNVSTAQDLTWVPETGQNRDFVFRVCSSDVVMGALLAEYAVEDLGARRAAVLYEVGREYSNKLARSFIERFEETAGRAPREFFYLALETDFRPQLELIADYRPDVVFVPGSFTDATLIGAQATDLGLTATFLGGDGWSNPLLFRRGGPPGEAYFAELCSPSAEFERRYQRVFGAPTQGCRALLGYDAVQVVAAGVRSLGPLTDEALEENLDDTRRLLRDAVATAEVEGASGVIRFDAHGDRRQGVALSAVERGPDGRPIALVRKWLGEP